MATIRFCLETEEFLLHEVQNEAPENLLIALKAAEFVMIGDKKYSYKSHAVDLDDNTFYVQVALFS
ncbi:hypothetical protein [Paenibacillus sp. SYP-B4298]|uniref:hypothetical protein n=1 Tax=Paenibacillus sp. SYP-B4298 TaxID=2996034 RepID=UPI0022DD4215|nr:hypothetical protein [Paenibacillus sp. SYP-B4298]